MAAGERGWFDLKMEFGSSVRMGVGRLGDHGPDGLAANEMVQLFLQIQLHAGLRDLVWQLVEKTGEVVS